MMKQNSNKKNGNLLVLTKLQNDSLVISPKFTLNWILVMNF